jgi:hypothetical protein
MFGAYASRVPRREMRCEPPGAPMPILNHEHLDPLIIAEAVFGDTPLMNQVAFKSMSHAAIPP